MEMLGVIVVVVGGLWLLTKSTSGRKTKPPRAQASRPSPPPRMTGRIVAENVNPERSQVQSRLARAPVKWLPNGGGSVRIGDRAFSGGMIYVGSPQSHEQPDASLIDPELPVNWSVPDREGSTLSYWPSYQGIGPEARAAYLEWLSTGRTDPTANVGYVFLFFYGLERRALIELREAPDAHEVATIRREVQRLLSIYSVSNSFRGYAERFLDALSFLDPAPHAYALPPPETGTYGELPGSLRIAIGQLLVESKPLPADWAFAWTILHPDTPMRTASRRCKEEIRDLFFARYKAEFGEGLRVAPNKTPLRLEYVGASLSLPRPLRLELRHLPDITALSAPLNTLRTLLEECTLALEPYSRLLGRQPAAKGSLSAIATLPPELASSASSPQVREFQEWLLVAAKGADFFAVSCDELVRWWSDVAANGVSVKETIAIAQCLERLGYGIEPDPRFGGPAPKAGETIILFKTESLESRVASPEYHASTILLHLGTAVAKADGAVSTAESATLVDHIESAMHLHHDERLRLRAHLQWLQANRTGLTRLAKRLEALSTKQKDGLVGFCLAVAGADGKVDAAEVRALRKIYATLGLEEAALYSHVHAVMSGSHRAEELATVERPARAPIGFVVPPSEAERREIDHGVTLDMNAVRAKMQETADVAALLSTIFVEETPAAERPAPPNATETIGPLDVSHSRLLRILLTHESLSRADFEGHTAALGLLPDGALDTINDAALDIVNAPICEGDDPIRIDLTLAQGLLP